MIKHFEVELNEFDYTVKSFDYGELQGTVNDGESVQKVIREYLSSYVPPSLMNSIHIDRCILDYRFNAFATKVTVGGTIFYFIADDIHWNENARETTFHIIASDEDTYLKERKLMLKTIEQINKSIERENAKKQKQIQDEELLKQLEKSAEVQKESYKVYYDSDGEVDLIRTSRKALEKNNLL